MNYITASKGSKARPGVRPLSSVLKTLALLDLLGGAARPMRLPELAQASGASRPTTFQKMRTLIEAGWVEYDPTNGVIATTLREIEEQRVEQQLGGKSRRIFR